ncbi:hypothetical protein ACI65C_008969 [Semiaphis heraclei]
MSLHPSKSTKRRRFLEEMEVTNVYLETQNPIDELIVPFNSVINNKSDSIEPSSSLIYESNNVPHLSCNTSSTIETVEDEFVLQYESIHFFVAKLFKNIEPLYDKPINSVKLGVAYVSNLSDNIVPITIDHLFQKYIVFNFHNNKQIALPILHSLDKTIVIVDSLVEAKNKTKKAMIMSDLSSTEETVSTTRKKEIVHSPTSSTNSCPMFLDSDNEDFPYYNKSKLSTSDMINSEHSNDCSSSPTVLNVPVAVINGIDTENILMYNKEPNCSPPVVTARLSDKTIKLNNRKKQNDNNREHRFMKQWSSKQKSLNETLKSCSEKQFSNTEPSSSKSNIEYNSEPLLKKKPLFKDIPANLSSFGNKQQCGSSFSKITVKNNKQAVVRELFNSSNNSDELSVLDNSNSSEKGKTYELKHPGSTRSVVAEDTPPHYSNNFQKQVLRMLTFITNEVRYLESGQAEILKKIENAADNYSNSETLTENCIKKSNKLCKNASVDEIEERIKYNLAQAPFNKKNK